MRRDPFNRRRRHNRWRRWRRRGSGDCRGVGSFGRSMCLGFDGSGGIVDRLLRRDVCSLATTDGRCARAVGGGSVGGSFRRRDRRRNSGLGSDGSTLAAAGSRGGRSSRTSLTGALFTLPPCPDTGHLVIGQPALRAQDRDVHRTQHGDDFIDVDLELTGHIHDAQLAQAQPPKVTPSARCRARWPARPAPTLRR